MSKPTNAAIVDTKGRKWDPFEVDTLTGYVTYTDTSGEIHIPYGTDPVSMTIQAHELSHVRYSAKLWPDVTKGLIRLTKLAGTNGAIVGYAEDMRITALAGRLGVKTLPEFSNKLDEPIIAKWVESFIAAGIPEDRVNKAIQFILTQHTSVVKAIGLDLNTLNQRDNAERYIVFCAQHLHKLLSKGEDKSESKGKSDPGKDKSKDKSKDKQPTTEPPSEDKDKSESEKSDDTSDKDKSEDDTSEGDTEDNDTSDDGEEGEGSDADAGESESDGKPGRGDDDATGDPGEIDLSEVSLPDLKAAMVSAVPPPVDTEHLIQDFQHTLDTGNWIPVPTIHRMPLVRRAAQARRKGRKLSETGVALGSAYDAISPNDRRPFVAKRKGGEGGLTVVIDCSGSMCISERQLEQLLLNHPLGVVVTYSSKVYGSARDADEAVVRVIASHGRLAATSDFRNTLAGGNGCDGPILEWLAKQPGERVWICDGVITGKEDSQVFYDVTARDAWLKAHRITQFLSLNSYLASFTR